MRAALLALVVVAALFLIVSNPYVGVLLWTWFSIQNPHREAFGFAHYLPFNLIIAVVTIGAWLLSNERKTPPSGALFWLLIAFLAWTTLSSFFAFDPFWSWTYWNRIWKTILLGLIVAATANNRVRIQALVWICVISLFYYGVKGGLFTIISGGSNHVLGPPGTEIYDNNQLAVALLMALPLANYLRVQTADRRISILMLASMVLTTIAVIGTYSRGALVGLAALGLLGLLRMKNRFLYLAIAAGLVFFTIHFMPDKFFERAQTIQHAQQDASFEGRLTAWQVAYDVARDRFPFGAGFYGPQLPGIFNHYYPGQVTHAAHSIYFQVLGEHGFVGLGIYLLILAAAFFRSWRIISVSRKDPARRWITDLGVALQASLFVFCVSGAALSLAYYDLFIVEISMLLPLWELLRQKAEEKVAPPSWAPRQFSAQG